MMALVLHMTLGVDEHSELLDDVLLAHDCLGYSWVGLHAHFIHVFIDIVRELECFEQCSVLQCCVLLRLPDAI